MIIKSDSKMLFLSICLLLLSINSCWAEIEVSGTIKAEIISDYLFFDPNSARTDPWRSGDQGGAIKPGFYPGDFTKIGLELKVTDIMDDRVEALLPLTVTVKAFSSLNNKGMWQTYLLADDYLNIPYYLSMRTNSLFYSLSSKPVGDPKFGFNSVNDPLGVAWVLNSPQPMMTLKVGGKLSNTLEGTAYIMFDQQVYGLPVWEMIPSGPFEIGSQNINFGTSAQPINKLVGECGFIDELAQYNVVRLNKVLANGLNLGFLWGQKSVDSPGFRVSGAEEDGTKTVLLKEWGYTKENIGVDLKGKLTSNTEVELAAVSSNVAWRKYDSQQAIDDQPFFRKRWYPYTTQGVLNGNAALLRTKLLFGKTTINLEGIAVDPTFQAVAAEQGQFPRISRLVQRDDSSGLERQVRAIFDPYGRLTGEKLIASPVAEFLGKRVLRFELLQPGQLGSKPVVLRLLGSNVAGLKELERKYEDDLNGSIKVKDYQEVCAEIIYSEHEKEFVLRGLTRDYLADFDYRNYLSISYNSKWKGLNIGGLLDNIWRLRGDDGFSKGQTTRFIADLCKDLPTQNLHFGVDYRTGNYDYDLITINSDRVVNPYDYLSLSLFYQKKKDIRMNGKDGAIILAGELINRDTDLTDVATGLTQIGYVGLEIPLSQTLTWENNLIGVKGPNIDSFPSGHIKTTIHNELIFKPYRETTIRVGNTIRPGNGNTKSNMYAVLAGELGKGNFSLTFGQGTLPEFTDDGIDLPGALPRKGVYGIGYPPAEGLRGRPWARWDNNNMYAIWNNSLRSTEATWSNYFVFRYWFSF